MTLPVLDDGQLQQLLRDDVPCGDLTTAGLGIGELPARLDCSARQPMTLCGVEEAARLFQLLGTRVHVHAHSGQTLAAGTPILSVEGSAGALHQGWKTAQVLMEWASGVASASAALVAAAAPLPVACTRKSAPGTKALAVKAIRAGGATLHRLGLSETLLLFAEHRLFLDEVPGATLAGLRRREPEKKIVVEVADLGEALRWAEADVLQLEKFTPAALAAVRRALGDWPSPPLLAAAGGIHAGNAAEYVAAGADLLVTSSPFSAPPKDVQVRFSRPSTPV
jgi:molybdenum transport protein